MPAFSVIHRRKWSMTDSWSSIKTSAEPLWVFKAEVWDTGTAQELHLCSNHITEPIFKCKSNTEGPKKHTLP